MKTELTSEIEVIKKRLSEIAGTGKYDTILFHPGTAQFFLSLLTKQEDQSQADDAEQLAQWVIDNRYAKNDNEKISDFEMYHRINEEIQALKQANAEMVEKAFNVGFDEGYTSPMGINAIITEGQYKLGRKVNYDLWASEYLDDFLSKHDKR